MELFGPGGPVVIADGGLATELRARGHDLSDALWSARLLVDAPEEIVAAHLAFFRAGAQIATTASYQASFDGFAARGIRRAEAGRLLRLSVELAKTARDRFTAAGTASEAGRLRGAGEPEQVGPDARPLLVAASVGPYGAVLADGSEYRGRYGLSVVKLAAWHRPRLEVLANASPDLLAVETIPDTDEAEALVSIIAGSGVPAWLSYTIEGGRTRAGQPLAEAFAVAAGVPEIVAVGVNCCAPADVPAAIAVAREITGKPVVVYPNSGEEWDADRRAWVGPARYSPGRARRWAAAGARIIGGCCRVRPADIAALSRALNPFRPAGSSAGPDWRDAGRQPGPAVGWPAVDSRPNAGEEGSPAAR